MISRGCRCQPGYACQAVQSRLTRYIFPVPHRVDEVEGRRPHTAWPARLARIRCSGLSVPEKLTSGQLPGSPGGKRILGHVRISAATRVKRIRWLREAAHRRSASGVWRRERAP